MHPHPDLKKLFIKIATIALALAVLMVVALATLPRFFGEKVKGIVVGEINRNLLVPVEIQQIEFTLFSSFPDASIVFRNVGMKPPANFVEAPGLIHAQSISLRFSILSIFTDNYRIQSLLIDGASVSLWKDKNAITNFDVWKKSSDTESKNVNFDLQHLRLRNTSIYYRDLSSGYDIAVEVPEMVIKGKISGQNYDIRADGKLLSKRIIVEEQNYSPNSAIEIHSKARIDDQLKSVFIESAKIKTTGIVLEASGLVNYSRKDLAIDLAISSKKSVIQDVVKFLPEKSAQYIKTYDPSGVISFDGTAKGIWSNAGYPEFSLDFNIENGGLYIKDYNLRLNNLATTGSFIRPLGKIPEKLNLTKFSFTTALGKYNGALALVDFKKIQLAIDLNADSDLEEITGLLPGPGLQKANGKFIADVKVKGIFAGKDRKIETASGRAALSNATVTLSDQQQISKINGRFELKNESVIIEQLSLHKGESDFSINGEFNNLVGYLNSGSSSLNFKVTIHSQKINIKDLLFQSKNASSSPQPEGMFPERIGFDAELFCNHLIYKKFNADKITGKLNLRDNVLRVSDLSFNASDGKVSATGLINGRYKNHAQVICNARLSQVDISRMFYEFENFGQSSLQSKHIRGRGDATIQYSSTLNNRFETDASSVTAIADVEIRNGELIDFEPMQELSRFLDAEELKNIRFSTLRNRIEVAEKTVIIPNMEVRSSVMDLKGYGSHTFGNDIDYHLNVALADLKKSKKRKDTAPEYSYTTGSQGETRLFLHLYGTVDNPQFRYDSQAVSKKIADDFKNQKQELRQVIREEFGKTPAPPTTTKQKTSTKFEIEWDED